MKELLVDLRVSIENFERASKFRDTVGELYMQACQNEIDRSLRNYLKERNMQVEKFKIIQKPVLKDLPYGECCTFPTFGNNMICMRIKTDQPNVKIVMKSEGSKSKCKMMNIADGYFHLVDPWEPCIPIKVKATVIS